MKTERMIEAEKIVSAFLSMPRDELEKYLSEYVLVSLSLRDTVLELELKEIQ